MLEILILERQPLLGRVVIRHVNDRRVKDVRPGRGCHRRDEPGGDPIVAGADVGLGLDVAISSNAPSAVAASWRASATRSNPHSKLVQRLLFFPH